MFPSIATSKKLHLSDSSDGSKTARIWFQRGKTSLQRNITTAASSIQQCERTHQIVLCHGGPRGEANFSSWRRPWRRRSWSRRWHIDAGAADFACLGGRAVGYAAVRGWRRAHCASTRTRVNLKKHQRHARPVEAGAVEHARGKQRGRCPCGHAGARGTCNT